MGNVPTEGESLFRTNPPYPRKSGEMLPAPTAQSRRPSGGNMKSRIACSCGMMPKASHWHATKSAVRYFAVHCYLAVLKIFYLDDGVITMESLIWPRAKFGINLVTSLLVRIL